MNSGGIDYDALEQAGYDYRLSCRRCGSVLETASAAILGVCTNCIQMSSAPTRSVGRPTYRTGNGKANRSK